jgi:predicted metal-dependent hydrolase
LVVRADGVECVLPVVCPERVAHDFIRQHRDWLTRKFREAVFSAPARNFWEDAGTGVGLYFPLQGSLKPFIVDESGSSRSRLSFDGEAFRLSLPRGASSNAAEMIERKTFTWAKDWLNDRIEPVIRHHADRLNVAPRDLRIKRMRTRWGSCGAFDDINLNWLLIAAPPAVLEYVIVHELCHIRHRDHSARFWHLVGTHFPPYLQSRRWLKAEGGALLNRFGPGR